MGQLSAAASSSEAATTWVTLSFGSGLILLRPVSGGEFGVLGIWGSEFSMFDQGLGLGLGLGAQSLGLRAVG